MQETDFGMGQGETSTGKPRVKLSETAMSVLDVVNQVIDALEDVATRSDLAKAAQLPSANLARTLRGENKPRPSTMIKLVTGAGVLLEAHRKALSPAEHDRLAAALDALPIEAEARVGGGGLVAAPGGAVPLDSGAYVHRDCDEVVAGDMGFVATGQSFEVTGSVASGRSSLLGRFTEAVKARGHDVLDIDLVSRDAVAETGSTWWLLADLVDQICAHVREISPEADLAGVDTAGITSATQANATVIAALEAWAKVPDLEPVLVVDGINFLDVDVVDAFISACRDDAVMVQCAVASASPRRTEQARNTKSFGRSTSLPMVDVPWFSGPRHGGTIEGTEIGRLARAYAPDRRAKVARLVETVALEAWHLFGGQPRLTHQYLHDNVRQDIGMTARVERVLQKRSPYQAHIDLLHAAFESAPDGPKGTVEVRRPAEDRPAPVEVLLQGVDVPDSQPMGRNLEVRAGEIGVLDPLSRRGLPRQWRSWFYCASIVLPSDASG